MSNRRYIYINKWDLLYISGKHAIAFSNSKKETILISVIYAEDLFPPVSMNLPRLDIPISYYNIELDEPDGMYAGGVPKIS